MPDHRSSQEEHITHGELRTSLFFHIAFLRRCSEGDRLLTLFLTFLKINLLIDSGPASVGLLHEEAVTRGFVTAEEFVEAVGFGSVLPGSETLQTALFVGYSVSGSTASLAALMFISGAVMGTTQPALMMSPRPSVWAMASFT